MKFTKMTRVLLLFCITLVISSCGLTDEKVKQTYDYLLDVVDFSYVTSDLHLPTKIGDVEIEYYSTNTDVLSNDGKIVRANVDQTIPLRVFLLVEM